MSKETKENEFRGFDNVIIRPNSKELCLSMLRTLLNHNLVSYMYTTLWFLGLSPLHNQDKNFHPRNFPVSGTLSTSLWLSSVDTVVVENFLRSYRHWIVFLNIQLKIEFPPPCCTSKSGSTSTTRDVANNDYIRPIPT
jgi:hypothetical protein